MRSVRALNVGAPAPETDLEGIARVIRPLLVVQVLQTAAIFGGLLLLIIPGIVFAVWFAFSQAAVVLDGAPALEALSQSRALVAGRFFKAAWRVLMGPFLLAFLYAFVSTLVIALLVPGADLASQADGMTPLPLWAGAIDAAATIFLIFPLSTIYATLLYEEAKKPRT
jgi:hypothetical protein